MADSGPTIRPYDIYANHSPDFPYIEIDYRMYHKYVYYPVYDQLSDSVIGYVPNFKTFLDNFITNYLSVTNGLYRFPNYDNLFYYGFSSNGKMLFPGEGYAGDVDFAFDTPWVTQTGSSFTNVRFGSSAWDTAMRPVIDDFTATIESIDGDSVVVTVGTESFNTTKSGSFVYGTYFTITLNDSVSVNDKIEVTVYIDLNITSSYEPTFPSYEAFDINFDTFYPSFVSIDGTGVKINPGYNIIPTSSLDIRFKDSNDVEGQFSLERFEHAGISYFYRTRPGASYLTHLMTRIFGDSTYPFYKLGDGCYGQSNWITQTDVDNLSDSLIKFKDFFKTQYTKKYLDFTYDDIKNDTAFSDTRAMSIQYPKYDEDGQCLNNPTFDADGRQVGGAYITKLQPWYDASMVQNADTVSVLVGDEVKELSIYPSILTGSAKLNGTGRKLSIAPTSLPLISRSSNRAAYGCMFNTNHLFGLSGNKLYILLGGHADSEPAAAPYKKIGLAHYFGFNPNDPIGDLSGYVVPVCFDPDATSMSDFIQPDRETGIIDCVSTSEAEPLRFHEDTVLLKSDGVYTRQHDSDTAIINNGNTQVVKIDTVYSPSGWDITFEYTYDTVLNQIDHLTPTMSDIIYSYNSTWTFKKNFSVSSPKCLMSYGGSSSDTWRANGTYVSIPIITSTQLQLMDYQNTYYESKSDSHQNPGGEFYLTSYIYDTPELGFSVNLPDDLKTVNRIRTMNTPAGSNTPVALYDDKIKLFNCYYDFKSVSIDEQLKMTILPIRSIYLSNSCTEYPNITSNKYFLEPYKVLNTNKLLATENLVDPTRVLSIGLGTEFDIDSDTNSLVYRIDQYEDDLIPTIKRINYKEQTSKKRTIDDLVVKKCKIQEVVGSRFYLVKDSSYFAKGQNWWIDGPNWSTFGQNRGNYKQLNNLEGKYVYIYRSGEFLQEDDEYVNFRVGSYAFSGASFISNISITSLSPSGDYDYTIIQPTDELVFFTTEQEDEPVLDNARELPLNMRSICSDGTHMYVLYKQLLETVSEESIHIIKIDETKFFNDEEDYIVATNDITSLDEGGTFWKATYHEFIYDSVNDYIWLHAQTSSAENAPILFRFRTSDLTYIKINILNSADKRYQNVITRIDDNTDKSHTITYFDEPVSYAYQSSFKPIFSINGGNIYYGYRKYDLDGNFIGYENDYFREQLKGGEMLLGYSGGTGNIFTVGQDITTSTTIKDIVRSGYGDNPVVDQYADAYFYICTKKASSLYYYYYKVVTPYQADNKDFKPYVKYMSKSKTINDFPNGKSEYAYTYNISGNIITLYTEHFGDSDYVTPPANVVNLSYFEDEIVSISSYSRVLNVITPFSSGVVISNFQDERKASVEIIDTDYFYAGESTPSFWHTGGKLFKLKTDLQSSNDGVVKALGNIGAYSGLYENTKYWGYAQWTVGRITYSHASFGDTVYYGFQAKTYSKCYLTYDNSLPDTTKAVYDGINRTWTLNNLLLKTTKYEVKYTGEGVPYVDATESTSSVADMVIYSRTDRTNMDPEYITGKPICSRFIDEYFDGIFPGGFIIGTYS